MQVGNIVFSKKFGLGEIKDKVNNQSKVYFKSINQTVKFESNKNKETGAIITNKFTNIDVFEYKYIINIEELEITKNYNFENLLYQNINLSSIFGKNLTTYKLNENKLKEILKKDKIKEEYINETFDLLLNIGRLKIKIILETNNEEKKNYRELKKEYIKTILDKSRFE